MSKRGGEAKSRHQINPIKDKYGVFGMYSASLSESHLQINRPHYSEEQFEMES